MSDQGFEPHRIIREPSQEWPESKTAAACFSVHGGPEGQRWLSQSLPIDYNDMEKAYDDVVGKDRSLYSKIRKDPAIEARIVCLDFRNSTSARDQLGVDIADTKSDDWDDFKSTLRMQPAGDTYLRLVIVEGLDTHVIRLLGSVFWLPSAVSLNILKI